MFTTIQPFILAKDFQLSKQFYLDFGFQKIYEDANLKLFKKDQVSFFLQNYYDKTIAENTVFQIYADNLDDIFHLLWQLKDKYPMIQVSPIHQAHYGQTMTLHDPSGVLFHLTNPYKK